MVSKAPILPILLSCQELVTMPSFSQIPILNRTLGKSVDPFMTLQFSVRLPFAFWLGLRLNPGPSVANYTL